MKAVILGSLMIMTVVVPGSFALAGDSTAPVLVNNDNFARAETAAQFDRTLVLTGGINRWYHFREPTPLDKQSVIRMNRDTFYSAAIVDISEGAVLTLPDPGERYLSVMVVNEDHFINQVLHEPGRHELTVEDFDTPYVNLSVRILVDSANPVDVAAVNALQDQLKIEAASSQPYTHPPYDEESYQSTHAALLELAREVSGTEDMFGRKEDVDPQRHLIGTAFGWGGLPIEEAYYVNVEPKLPVGAYSLTVKDVPVDAFWSISLYNRDGYFEANEFDAYSVNNITGVPNEDGSFTVHFGGDPESVNYLPIMDGWNYTVRLYQPREEILDGTWEFPAVEPVN